MPSTVGGPGFTGCDVLDQAGIDRIAGLGALLPPLHDPVRPGDRRLEGRLLPDQRPGLGSRQHPARRRRERRLEGRGGNDIIDGDRALTVRISVRTDPADPGTEIGSTDLMEHPP